MSLELPRNRTSNKHRFCLLGLIGGGSNVLTYTIKRNTEKSLLIDGVTLTESMAILQYLEDTRPQPSLAPSSPLLRARVREIVETVVAGIQPLQNVGLRASFEDDSQYTQFGRNWTMRGLETLEELLSRTARDRMYCVGDQLTFADLCLVPQVYNAVGRHKININKYPTVAKLYEALLKDDVFATTHPDKVKNTQ